MSIEPQRISARTEDGGEQVAAQPAPAAEPEPQTKTYLSGALYAYLMEADAMTGRSEVEKAARAALEAAEMQSWKGGSSAWVTAARPALREIGLYLESLSELMRGGVLTGAEVGVQRSVVDKTAERFAQVSV
ncbi:hypothetical protein ACIRPQ_29380 [Streptomyces sp. NPDC101213]|uniref:hypothetical protein n=1 Tax=Streptomyces sp. NPDC101213 TaxID=3366130 RepID=UPI003817029F